MSVREARPADAAQVADLLTEFGSPGVDQAEATIRLARGEETIYVDEDDGSGRLGGLIAVKTELYFGHARPAAHVTALVTRSQARRTGVGKRLMAAAVAYARAHDCAGVELTSGLNPQREAAHRFYPALGFEVTSYRYWLPLDS